MSLKIETTQGEWEGTFALAAKLIIEDVLSDGEPFLAWATYELESGGTETIVALIQSLVAGRVKFKQGGCVGYFNLVDLISLEVL